jgi:hypothetical protein
MAAWYYGVLPATCSVGPTSRTRRIAAEYLWPSDTGTLDSDVYPRNRIKKQHAGPHIINTINTNKQTGAGRRSLAVEQVQLSLGAIMDQQPLEKPDDARIEDVENANIKRETPLSAKNGLEMHEMANLTDEEKQAERRYVLKLDLIVLPLIAVMYFLATLVSYRYTFS